MKKIILIVTLAGVLPAANAGVQGDVKPSPPPYKVSETLERLDLREVKVAGELGRRIALTVKGNLLQLDIDKDFLAALNGGNYTGFYDPTCGPYLGVGNTLEGMVWLAANTGDQALIARKNHMVETIIKSQASDGYIGLWAPERRATWTLLGGEEGGIIQALVSEYQVFGNQGARDAARRLADYMIKRWSAKPADWEKIIPVSEYFADGELNCGFLALFDATGDQRYLDFASNELGTQKWNVPIVLGRYPPIDGQAVYYLTYCRAQLELYRLRADPELLTTSHRVTKFMTQEDGMLVTGAVGKDECWTNDQDGRYNLGETCATALENFLFDRLLRLEGDSRWGDLIERSLYNTVFGAQSPDGRRLRYFTTFDGKKFYWPYDSYCCPGNFRRLIGAIPQLIYYRGANGLAVNLYTASQATVDHVGGTKVTIRQETDYPSSGRITVHIDPQDRAVFPLLLRIPRWCASGSVQINGLPLQPSVSVVGIPFSTAVKPGGFLRIDRTWQRGDTVTLELPMAWQFILGRRNQSGRAAVMRGPLVYTLDPAINPATAGIDLDRIVLLPATATLVDDDTVRPGGTACRIRADLDTAGHGALTLTLTEFPNPKGQAIYFHLADTTTAVDDELLSAPMPWGARE